MGGTPPKKRRSKRKQGMHRSHLVRELAEKVNAHSPVKVVLSKKKLDELYGNEKTAKKSIRKTIHTKSAKPKTKK